MRRTVPEMLGEFFREAAVLVIVFVPLIRVFEQNRALTLADILITLGIGGGLLIFGILFEVKRK